MKKLYILVLVLLAINSANAQGCLPDGIEFTKQAQIDSFQINYPGCTEIEGNVAIYPDWGSGITNLNGLSVLTSIGGDLLIGSVTMSDLTGLDNVSSIGGTLSIASYSLVSLTGLEKITSVGRDVNIRSGPHGWVTGSSLTSLMGLKNLTSIGGNLAIGANSPYLTNLTGLDSLKFIGGDLYITGTSLTSLSGIDNIEAGSISGMTIHGNNSLSFCNVKSICDYLASPNGTVEIYNNASGCNNPWEIAIGCGISLPCLPYGNYYFFSQAEIDNFQAYSGCATLKGNVTITGHDIANLNGLNQVTSITGALNIGYLDRYTFGNPMLTSLTGLENLTYIGGNLLITQNDTLSSLTGLDNLTSIGGSAWIGVDYTYTPRGNYALKSLEGLRKLSTVGGELYISSSALTNFSGLDSLIAIGGGFTIVGNDLLKTLTGVENLHSIGGLLHIFYNNALTTISGLANVSAIGGISIDDNRSLKSLEGLEKLISIGDGTYGLSIAQNDSLASLKGLDNIKSINGDLSMYANPQLSSVAGLDELISVWGDLILDRNGALTSLTGLENLKSIGGDLNIQRNGLTSLAGLDNLNAASINNLTIMSNPSLSTCSVQTICDYLASPNGVINIGYNATGCFGVWEVEAGCDSLSIGDLKIGDPLSIYPNPTTGEITIETDRKAHLTILSFNGQELITRQITESKTQIDISNLPCGLYFVRLTNDRTVGMGKIIKQ